MHDPDPRHVQLGKAMRAVRRHLGLAQRTLAKSMGCTRQHLSAFETGRDLPIPDTWHRWLGAVGAATAPVEGGDESLDWLLQRTRRLYAQAQAEPADLQSSTPGPSPTVHHRGTGEGDGVRRRDFGAFVGSALAGAVLEPGGILSALAFALTRYQLPHQHVGIHDEPDLGVLSLGVQQAKMAYQACRYETVGRRLPRLLDHLEVAAEHADVDTRLRVDALTAEVYHVAASVLLKLSSQGLAWVAADRSMKAAQRSQDPVIVAASARIVTHALMSGGHHAPAKTLAATEASRLDGSVPRPTPESLSVYGALLLRGAIAAAGQEDAHTARQLLDEADQTAGRLGGDHNHRWTAFGATNVLAHRVNIEIALGNAGAALEVARGIQLGRLGITERKAAVLIDTARAYVMWGKLDRAVAALLEAEDLAQQELRVRPAVHNLVAQVRRLAPPSVHRQATELAERLGVA